MAAAKPEKPISFGYKCAWYAIRTNDINAVVSTLDLKGVVESPWSQGIDEAFGEKVFVTPPLGDWILAVGLSLCPKDDAPARTVLPILTKLSKAFGEAQYFASHRVVEAHCWALAHSGKLIRAFCFVGDRGTITWNEGKPTKTELALGVGALEFPGPSEGDVMELAGEWSVNPCELESNFTQPGLGRLGTL